MSPRVAKILGFFGLGGGGGGVKASAPGGGFNQAKPDRLDAGWKPGGYGPNADAEAAVGGSGDLHDRTEDLADTNEHVDGGIETVVDNVVAGGITAYEPATPWPDVNEAIKSVWAMACERVDSERQMHMAESQAQLVRSLHTSGEVGVDRPMAGEFRGYPTMPALDLVDRQRLPLGAQSGPRLGMLGGAFKLTGVAEGHTVRAGVEFDGLGRTVAYHVLADHPKDGLGSGMNQWMTLETVRIPVERMEWVFINRRVGQIRGISPLVTMLRTVRTEAGYVRDSMAQAKSSSMFGLVIKTANSAFRTFFADGKKNYAAVDAGGNPTNTIGAGSITVIQKDDEIVPVSATLPGPTFKETVAVLLRRISRALRVTYSHLSGDSSGENFASMRGHELHMRRWYKRLQRLVWWHHTEPYLRDVIDWGVLTGRIPLTVMQARRVAEDRSILYRGRPVFPGFSYVNPSQEASANETDIKCGVRSTIECIQEEGRDWRTTVQQTVDYALALKEAVAKAGLTMEELALARTIGTGTGVAADAGGAADPAADGSGDGSQNTGSGNGNGGGNNNRRAA